jgi:V/A-type H+/Na+-transporting ATPase subunit D
MDGLKFTKKTLREEQRKLAQLETYLPTLQLKKKLLQFEVFNCHNVIEELFKKFQRSNNEIDKIASLFSHGEESVTSLVHIQHVEKIYENIAGVELPKFLGVIFSKDSYSLFDTPIWTDSALEIFREMIKVKQQMNVEEEKRRALSKELNEVSIRLNLFEKILIPRKKNNIKKIRIFLGDQELAAVAQAKMAKTKILEKK